MLREKQDALAAERHKLRVLLAEAPLQLPVVPRGIVGIGSQVTLSDNHRYSIAGDWTPRAGSYEDGAMVLSTQSPLAQNLLGKRVGDTVGHRRHETATIIEVQ